MNAAGDRSDFVADAAIDRLVDGCLDDAERRELLIRLDGDPDGWRRCALGFLEDQVWRSALTSPVIAPAGSAQVSPASTGPRRSRVPLRRLSIAASVLAATFAAGLGVGGASLGRGPIAVARPEALPAKAPRPDPIREVGSIALVDGSSGEAAPDRIPILAGPGLDERWLRDQPPSVPEYLRAQWERQGYQVEQRRRLVSVVLQDGRRVSIPVDEVALEYVGQQAF